MNRDSQRLIGEIERVIQNFRYEKLLIRDDLKISLSVTDINDEDPGVRYSVSPTSEPHKKDSTCYREPFELSSFSPFTNPIFYERAIRKAETVAAEVWTHYTSMGMDVSVTHHNQVE